MNLSAIREEFKRKVCDQVDIEEQGLSRFVVYTPFMFDDGDHFVIVLKHEDDKWVLTDEGHTFMHMSYDEIDVSRGTRKSVIDQALSNFAIINDSGELRLGIPDQYYPVDCRVNGTDWPLLIFAISNDDRCRDATITIHQFERWGRKFHSMAVFEDQTQINQRVLARFSDVVGKQFSNLGVRDRIESYLEETLNPPSK